MTKAPPRPPMSQARRQRIWDRDGGVCYWCTAPVLPGQSWDVEHKRPWAESQDDTDPNLGVIHRRVCHKAKSAEDAARLAKAKAQAGETGQWARRQRNGPQIKSAGFPKDRPKTQWAKRPMQKRIKPPCPT